MNQLYLMSLAHVAEQETENHILYSSTGIIERDGVHMIPIITKLPLARRRESNQQSSWARSGASKNSFTYRFLDKIHLNGSHGKHQRL